MSRRAMHLRSVATCLVVLSASTWVAAASADDLPGSPPELYRSTAGSLNLASNGHDGQGVTVAVIDTGVADVPGMDGKVIRQKNISAAPEAGDQFGHGTFVAGIVHKVAPGADIVSIKLSGADGSVDVTQVMAALQWVVANRDRYGIDVVNLSFGNDSKQPTKYSPLNYAVQRVWDAGIVVVASAGNLGDHSGTVTKPGDDPLIISVGATDEQGTTGRGDDTIPTFVSRGPTQDGLAKPDLVAPGARVISLRAPGSTIDVAHPEARIGEDGFRGSGTSFAAPVVSGVVAQMLSADPSLTPDEVKHAILTTATAVNGDPTAMGAGTIRGMRALNEATGGRANADVERSVGTGSLEASRGSAKVEVATPVETADGDIESVPVLVEGERTAEVVPVAEAPNVPTVSSVTSVLETVVADTVAPTELLDTYQRGDFLDKDHWNASQWGASQWGASQWGASQWGASQWGASQWGASQWGASQWWASQWG